MAASARCSVCDAPIDAERSAEVDVCARCGSAACDGARGPGVADELDEFDTGDFASASGAKAAGRAGEEVHSGRAVGGTSAASAPPSPSRSGTDPTPASQAAPALAAVAPPQRGGLDETVTQHGHDTVGGLDTDAPDVDEEALRGWKDGQLVADRFRLVRKVGQGGMGRVYLARDEALGREIALKRIPQEIIFDVDARDDLRQEANRLLDLAHDNIVRVHTYYDGPTWPFFAMEYLEGPTLKQLLRDRKREERTFEAGEIVEIARQVGAGLAHAHSHSIVHRDLKPANLMLAKVPEGAVGPEDLVKITDFGISRVVADSTLRQTGKRSGTLPYMSPEQFRGEPSTPQSDVYSFACTLYELATGSPPFYSGDIGYQILNILPHPPDGLPSHLSDAILRALAKEPQERFESVERFIEALEGKLKVKPPRPRAAGGWASLASKAVAGVVFAVVALTLAALFDGDLFDDSVSPTSSAASGARFDSPLQESHDRTRFVEWLRSSVDEQLPLRVGREFGQLSPTTPRLTFALRFKEAEAPRGASLLSRLVFERVRTSPDGDLARQTTRGVAEAGVWTFKFLNVLAGDYQLRAYVERKTGGPLPEFEVFSSRPLSVDLTAPIFDVSVDRADLVAADDAVGTTVFSTFNDALEFRIVTAAGTDDIANASYQVVSEAGVVTEEQPIADLSRHQVALPYPGLERVLRVHATDRAGNRSADREFRFLRRRIELEQFVTVETVGNTLEVRGQYVVEGDVLPALVFYVNGSRVDVDWTILADDSALSPDGTGVASERDGTIATTGGEVGPALRRVPFTAKLPLGRATNTVEVRYEWGGKVRSFGTGATLPPVQLRAPRVRLEIAGHELPGRDDELLVAELDRTIHTRESRVTVFGTVEDFFPGLGVMLRLQAPPETASNRRVILEPSGTLATFSEDLELGRGLTNTITVECFYNSPTEPLIQTTQPFVVVSDPDAPVGRLTFELEGSQVIARVQTRERLLALQGRLSTDNTWTDIDVSDFVQGGSLVYTWRFPDPRMSAEVVVAMTDLAGNRSEVRELYVPMAVASSPPSFERPRTRDLVFRAPFLRGLGMSFVRCGTSDLEIGTTEVPEVAWFRFLEERGLRDEDAGPARDGYPMVLGDYPVKLIKSFVRWFEAQAADGYAYAVPTADEWLQAFAGVDARQDAEREIGLWFERDFTYGVLDKYGQNRTSAIGSRPHNATPTRLLDMESNVQEIVFDREGFEAVIGGHNQLDDVEKMQRSCVASRPWDPDQRGLLGRFTGLRLSRRPGVE